MFQKQDNIFRIVAVSILVSVMIMISGQASAQQAIIDKILGRGKDKEASDSTEVKHKKPLESFFFDDSIRNMKIFAWNAKLDRNRIDTITIDTVLNRFEVDYEFMREDVGAAYLGNLGGPVFPLNYFRRAQMTDFTFLRSYEHYLKTPQNARHFNVKVPFSNLSWYMSGQTRNAEEQLRVTHAQNISPSTGFNIDYKNRGTKGMYSSQKSKDKNLSLALAHTGKRYSTHAGYIYNMGDIRENGGIKRDTDVTDTIYDPPYNIEVNLRDANNLFKNNTFYISQSYGIPLQRVMDSDFSIAEKSTIFVGHYSEYSKVKKIYTDTKARSGDFYDNWYINPHESRDSIFESKFDNKVFIQMQPWDRNAVIGTIDAGIGHSMHEYYMFSLDDYFGKIKNVKKNDTYVYGSVAGKIKKYIDWTGDITYHPVGFRSQDINVNAQLNTHIFIKQKPLSLSVSGTIDRRTPSFWDENYLSNHYMWKNSFNKETETRIEAKLQAPFIGFEAGAWQTLVTDKIYYNENGLPAQYDGELSVSALYLRKDFSAGVFRFYHRGLLQWSSQEEVAPVPLFSAYITYFADFFLVKNILRIQTGIDGWYNTKYYGPGYNPATMQFYNQREKKLGDYPFVDFFLAAKWKRMRILIKVQHLNEDMVKRNYFTVLHHPLNRRMFKLGFSWSFYD